jgi:predicted DNA-binding antitoxin AbrB/MazE fold protein
MEIQGHIENGIIIPHDITTLPDGTEVTIVVREQAERSADKMSPDERRRYLEELARIDAVSDENPGDTFSGADHDKVLYGERS